MGMGYLIVLYVRLGAKIWDLYVKDSNLFCNRLIRLMLGKIFPVFLRYPTMLLNANNANYSTMNNYI